MKWPSLRTMAGLVISVLFVGAGVSSLVENMAAHGGWLLPGSVGIVFGLTILVVTVTKPRKGDTQ